MSCRCRVSGSQGCECAPIYFRSFIMRSPCAVADVSCSVADNTPVIRYDEKKAAGQSDNLLGG